MSALLNAAWNEYENVSAITDEDKLNPVMEVLKAEKKVSEKTKNPYGQMVLQVPGDDTTKSIYHTFFLPNSEEEDRKRMFTQMKAFLRLLQAFGFVSYSGADDDSIKADMVQVVPFIQENFTTGDDYADFCAILEGRTVQVQLSVEQGQNGEWFNNVKRFMIQA